MSMVMPNSRELPAGPTAGLLPCKAEADDHQEGGSGRPLMINGFLGRMRPGDSSGSSSSIGVPGESSESASEEEEEDEETEVQSKFRPSRGALRTLGSLEDSLPIKRGLSSHFSGKSKSFASLADVLTKPSATAADIAKPENPFNKRRRILMMANSSQWPRRASCSSLVLNHDGCDNGDDEDESSTIPAAARLPPLPLRPLREEDGDDDDEAYDDLSSLTSRMVAPLPPPQPRRLRLEGNVKPMSSSFRSPRSFSLTDLQQHQYANDFD